MNEASWAVVIPVKPAAHGKSRLDVPGLDRVALARAIALDTIAAAAACPLVDRVLVVTEDPALAVYAGSIPGVRWIDEAFERERRARDAIAGRETTVAGHGLNGAIALGIDTAGERMPRAALLGDLPALRPEDLTEALRRASALDRTVVADAEGTGSTLVTVAAQVPWRSSFGDGSLTRHVELGCTVLDLPATSTLRRDVDTADQLSAAAALGLGPRTAAVVSAG